MKVIFKATAIAGVFVCLIMASCQQEEQAMPATRNIPVVSGGEVFSVQSDDNPKKIKGKLKSSLTDQPIVGADVLLYDQYGVLVVEATLTNDTGGFVMDSIFVGDYELHLSAFGYNDIEQPVSVPLAGEVYDLGDILMTP